MGRQRGQRPVRGRPLRVVAGAGGGGGRVAGGRGRGEHGPGHAPLLPSTQLQRPRYKGAAAT